MKNQMFPLLILVIFVFWTAVYFGIFYWLYNEFFLNLNYFEPSLVERFCRVDFVCYLGKPNWLGIVILGIPYLFFTIIVGYFAYFFATHNEP